MLGVRRTLARQSAAGIVQHNKLFRRGEIRRFFGDRAGLVEGGAQMIHS